MFPTMTGHTAVPRMISRAAKSAAIGCMTAQPGKHHFTIECLQRCMQRLNQRAGRLWEESAGALDPLRVAERPGAQRKRSRLTRTAISLQLLADPGMTVNNLARSSTRSLLQGE